MHEPALIMVIVFFNIQSSKQLPNKLRSMEAPDPQHWQCAKGTEQQQCSRDQSTGRTFYWLRESSANLFRQARLDDRQKSVNIRRFKSSSRADISHDFIPKSCNGNRTQIFITKMESSNAQKQQRKNSPSALTQHQEEHRCSILHFKYSFFPTRLNLWHSVIRSPNCPYVVGIRRSHFYSPCLGFGGTGILVNSFISRTL